MTRPVLLISPRLHPPVKNRVCVSVRVCVCACVCMHLYTGDHTRQDFFGKYIPQIAIWGETHPCKHPSLVNCNYVISSYIMCASIHAYICACVCMHLYIIITCSVGPEVAALDWYGPEAKPIIILARGRGGGTPGTVWNTHSWGESFGASPQKENWEFRPSCILQCNYISL